MTATLLADGATRTSGAEAVLFWTVAPIAVVASLAVVWSAKAVHSAIFLAMTMIILALLYFAQDAMFLAVVQVVVYTGAVMMVFLFVLMLIGVDSTESLVETLRGQRIAATMTSLAFAVLLAEGIGKVTSSGFAGLGAANAGGNVQGLAALIFTRYLWAFELTSALLITAALGAMVLAHRDRIEHLVSQKELSQRRFQPGGHATPRPNPGVYAHDNAVDMPALLPDGSPAYQSVSTALQPRRVQPRAPRRESLRHRRIVAVPLNHGDGHIEQSTNGQRQNGSR